MSVKSLRYYAGYADKNHGKVIPLDGEFFAYTRHEVIFYNIKYRSFLWQFMRQNIVIK